MKNKINRLLLTLILVLAMVAPVYAEVVEEFNGISAEEMETSSEAFYSQCLTYTQEDLETAITSFEGQGMTEMAQSYESLLNLLPSIQNAEFGEFTMETVDEGDAALKLTLELICESGSYEQVVLLDESVQIVSFSYQEKGGGSTDFGALMQKAGLNTLLGMGIVFAVLILISILIALLKYIPMLLSGKKKEQPKAEEKTQPAVQAAPVAAVPAKAVSGTDDAELVAVIAAAVAAAMGTTSTDGFVVRSIKKRKW